MQLQNSTTNPSGQTIALPERRRYLTIPETSNVRPFTVPSLRDIRFKSRDRINSRGDVIPGNGSAAAWITIGRKVLLDLDAFDKWIDAHRGQQ